MDFQAFKASLTQTTPPAELNKALQALWQAAKGDWKAAHVLAQAQDDAIGAWVHAYLHREEGDAANAAYWYRRANRPVSQESLEKEWAEIAQALL
jgi:hypothetical protein